MPNLKPGLSPGAKSGIGVGVVAAVVLVVVSLLYLWRTRKLRQQRLAHPEISEIGQQFERPETFCYWQVEGGDGWHVGAYGGWIENSACDTWADG
jgi:hypothetical protein